MQLVISEPDYATRRALISAYCRRYDGVNAGNTRRFAGHAFSYSDWDSLGKLEFRFVEVAGPTAKRINPLLSGKRLWGDAFLNELNYYVFVEVNPADTSKVIHVIDMRNGKRIRRIKTHKDFHSHRPGTRELLLHLTFNEMVWSRYNIDTGTETEFFTGGYKGYVSADGRCLFPVDDWSSIGLVDIASGELLDRKTKRHLSRYATKVTMLHVIRFEPKRPRLFVLLMRQQYLAYRLLIKEKLIQIDVEEER